MDMALSTVMGRTIICAYNVFAEVQARYPRRKVVPEARADSDCMYYWNGRGQMRVVVLSHVVTKIYVTADWPYIRQVWPRRKRSAGQDSNL